MKKILGLDLGTTSIGWAYVNEAETSNEVSNIVKAGVRVVPLSTDETTDFEKGKATSINADRTSKRGMRRKLQRYKQRRKHLANLLISNKIINDKTILTEAGENSTHNTYKIRARAAVEKVSLEEFARILFAINKKRGYKSNRKTQGEDEDEGQAIDGMEVAKTLYNEELTPGQYCLQLLTKGKKHLPDFYQSDLQAEFDKVWECQKKYYPQILVNTLKETLKGKNKGQSWKICESPFQIKGIKLEGKREYVRLQSYQLRAGALSKQISLEHLAIVLQNINAQISNSSGYLGAISDRSKELYFKKITVGQYLNAQLEENPQIRLKNQVFYRQDYLDEFERIWSTQAKFHSQLTPYLKKQIRDTVIFYQRKLKSQKGLLSICEFERKEVTYQKEGKTIKKFIGSRVIPKSSPLFQEFKIWQILNNLKFTNNQSRETFEISELDEDLKIRNHLYEILSYRGKLSSKDVVKGVFTEYNKWELANYKEVEGNNTMSTFFKCFNSIVELSGHQISKTSSKQRISKIFDGLNINTDILTFDSDNVSSEIEKQPAYQLWHLLYSYESDNSPSGQASLVEHLNEKFGFEKEYAKLLANISFKDDYGSLSSKAIKKILPFLKDGFKYSDACELAGYNHSHSLTKQDIEQRELDTFLELVPKNSLRNPVVEKILNQMVNVVNSIIKEYGPLDEIRIEFARELKKSAKERAKLTKTISSSTKAHVEIREKISQIYPFNTGVRITNKDIIKYKLYQELEFIGHKTLYTNKYIQLNKLFTKEFDVDHIIPRAVLFDDSFSNKTLSTRKFNLQKSNSTGYDAVLEKFGKESAGLQSYILNADSLLKENKISKSKHKKLLMKVDEIPDGFIERDLRNTQYIVKKAHEMLRKVVRQVTPTTGRITDKLREDWQLINVLQELNWEKYEKLGLTTYEINKDGDKIRKIINWTKRNDHRHHALDAIVVAFTKHSHVQYFNYKSARENEMHKLHKIIKAIENKETYVSDNGKKLIVPPISLSDFRKEVKNSLMNILISFKAKNKVVTKNKNKTKSKIGTNTNTELTPRGQLHKETVYGKSQTYTSKWLKVGGNFDMDTISKVAKKSHRIALERRLSQFGGDPKKAFCEKNALSKHPVYLDENKKNKLPEKVKIVFFTDQYTIRKDISPSLKIEKVVDKKIQKILNQRLKEYDNDPKKAFVNLEKNPIWLNEGKNIQIKRVTITGVNNAMPLHHKKDQFGNTILDEDCKPIPVDFVSTGNNHHVAIYKDEKGEFQEQTISFYETVLRMNQGTPIVDKDFNSKIGWQFLFTIKQNEYFIFPNEQKEFDPKSIDLTDEKNYKSISPNLFRVQKISNKDYFFRHHFETSVENNNATKSITWKRVTNLKDLESVVKVHINHIGKIVKVGE